jgi:hypothetical protein
MLRNRHLQVKMVNDKDIDTDPTEEKISVDPTTIIREITKGVVVVVGVYVAADTFRQATIQVVNANLEV